MRTIFIKVECQANKRFSLERLRDKLQSKGVPIHRYVYLGSAFLETDRFHVEFFCDGDWARGKITGRWCEKCFNFTDEQTFYLTHEKQKSSVTKGYLRWILEQEKKRYDD